MVDSMQTMQNLKSIITKYAIECGFDLVRITNAEEFVQDRDVALNRIDDGYMDGLSWFTESRVRRGANPETLLPGARSIICLGLSYLDETAAESGPSGSGKVAQYALVKDYHRAMKRRMKTLVLKVQKQLNMPLEAKWYVDDGPMLDRAAAARSGLGWFGKNTNILTSTHGSWILLGQIITNLELEPDTPLNKNCGSCIRCIDDCPTGAIIAPFVVDNARCISYQTIENHGIIPLEIRPLIGDWIFGCDICQDVCPVNRRAHKPVQPIQKTEPIQATGTLDLVDLLALTEEQFNDQFRGTSMMRAKRVGLQKNACIALGNGKHKAAVPALISTLTNPEPLLRGHAAWALGAISTYEALSALKSAAESETDSYVIQEIQDAIKSGIDPAEARQVG